MLACYPRLTDVLKMTYTLVSNEYRIFFIELIVINKAFNASPH